MLLTTCHYRCFSRKSSGANCWTGSTVPFVQHEQGISIQVPKEKWEPIDTVIQLVIETSD